MGVFPDKIKKISSTAYAVDTAYIKMENYPNMKCIVAEMNKYVTKKRFTPEELKGLNKGCYLLLTFLFEATTRNKDEEQFVTKLKDKLTHLGNACFQDPNLNWFNLIDVNQSTGSDAVCLMIKNAYEVTCHEIMTQTAHNFNNGLSGSDDSGLWIANSKRNEYDIDLTIPVVAQQYQDVKINLSFRDEADE